MTTTRTEDVATTLIQVHALATQGADIVRVAVPHERDARALARVVAQAGVPIVADVHFSHRLALLALQGGVQGLRLNPGNIRNPDHIRTVVREAAARNIPIRVGAPAGSLDRALLRRYGGPTPKALVQSALDEVRILEDERFFDIKISVKHHNVRHMIAAYRLLAARTSHPLHLGVTEAGPPPAGVVKSSIGIGTLLPEGIGDTIRGVSDRRSHRRGQGGKAHPAEPRAAAHNIRPRRLPVVRPGGTRRGGAHEESPGAPRAAEATCGAGRGHGLRVNGPGEARDADVGLAAGPGRGLLFSRGRRLGWVPVDRMVDALLEEAVKVAESRANGSRAD